MKSLLLILLGSLLAACMGPYYRYVEPAGGGSYLLAQSPSRLVHLDYPAGYYEPLLGYGFYPWWSHSYYSPNFYPHYFSFWYPSWPGYYYGHPGFQAGGHRFGAWPGHYQPIGSPPAAMPGPPVQAPPTLVVAPVEQGRLRPVVLDGEDLNRNPAMFRHKGAAFAPRAVQAPPDSGPADAAASARPTVRSFFSPARSAPAFAPGPRADSPLAGPGRPALERSHRPADHSPPHHDR